jgi:Fur family transcriptional regulator, ferric uptake regulator
MATTVSTRPATGARPAARPSRAAGDGATASADSELDTAVSAALTRHGVRYTAHRRALVVALSEAGQPLTIPQIVVAAASLPQSSVYRNLAIFDEAGVVHRMAGTDGFARYELAEGVVGHHHHHMVCSNCGAVADVTLPQSVEADLERALRQVARRHGFSLASHRLDLVGDCVSCESPGG